jgi:hypothetical protein
MQMDFCARNPFHQAAHDQIFSRIIIDEQDVNWFCHDDLLFFLVEWLMKKTGAVCLFPIGDVGITG